VAGFGLAPIQHLCCRLSCELKAECYDNFMVERVSLWELTIVALLVGGCTQQPTLTAATTVPKAGEVALARHDGTLSVPVTINDSIRLNFTVDSGATDVVIPGDILRTLVLNGTIASGDFTGQQDNTLADGSNMHSLVVHIRSLRVGDASLDNVTAVIAPPGGVLLLGQSFLAHFKSWSINNERQVLVLN
jgi:clan AA aspartic protease (TIGR02281 family)